MLSKGAESILKILINLYQESGEIELCDSCKIFPKGYQNGLTYIFAELEQNGIIYNPRAYTYGDFSLDLSPEALTYFDDNDKTEKEKQTAQSIIIHNFTATGSNVNLGTLSHSTMTTKNTVSFIEKEIEEKGGEDKEELRDLLEEIKELCDNIHANKSLPKSKNLMNRISKHFETHGWFYGAIVQLIGTAAMQVMTGK